LQEKSKPPFSFPGLGRKKRPDPIRNPVFFLPERSVNPHFSLLIGHLPLLSGLSSFREEKTGKEENPLLRIGSLSKTRKTI
jgi:hypothetical protein